MRGWQAASVAVVLAALGCTRDNPAYGRGGEAGTGTNSDSGSDSDDSPELEPDAQEQACSVDWWNDRWTHRVRLTARNAGLSSPIEDFPAKVLLSSDELNLSALSDDARDVRFIDPDCTRLDYQLLPSGPDAVLAWVRVPQLQPSGNVDFIWAYWGAAGEESRSDPQDVWRGYDGVWHFDEDQVRDSSPRGRHGRARGTEIDRGMVGSARRFFPGEPHLIEFPDSEDLFRGWDEFAVSHWIYPDYDDDAQWSAAMPDYVLRKDGGGTGYGRTWREDWLESGHGHFQTDFVFEDAGGQFQRFVIPRGEWSHVVYHYDGQNYELYLNGELYEQTGMEGDRLVAESRILLLGDEQHAMDGKIDELMISRRSRTRDWFWAEHASMVDALWSVGAAERQR